MTPRRMDVDVCIWVGVSRWKQTWMGDVAETTREPKVAGQRSEVRGQKHGDKASRNQAQRPRPKAWTWMELDVNWKPSVALQPCLESLSLVYGPSSRCPTRSDLKLGTSTIPMMSWAT